jgi:hypothetical protein
MFRIYADNALIYDSSLDDYVITKGQIEREVNKSGKFTFTLYSDHRYFGRIQELKTIIKIYRDDSLVFRGRVLSYVDGFDADRTFTCEGELSFFVDSVQRPYTFQGTPAELFAQFVASHNSQVEETKRFTVGEVTVEDPNDYIRRENGSYEDTLTNLTDRLTGSLGGYITFSDGPGGARVINWLAEYGSLSSQVIRFGENLLDYARTRSAESIATVLIPLGAQTEDGKRVTIESVNGGKDYIVDETAAARYGLIWAVEIWDDVTEPANLLTKGRAKLAELSSLITSIELTAIDLSDLDKDIDAFALGDMVRVISPPHGLDAVYMLTKQTVDILAPENNRITLGHTFSGFTDRTVDASQLNSRLDTLSVAKASKDSVEAVQSEVSSISGQISAIEGGAWTGLTLNSEDWTASKTVQYRSANRQVFITGAISPVLAYGASAAEIEFASGIPEALRPAAKVKVLQSGEDLFTFLITVRSDGTLAISKYSDPSGYGAMSPATIYEFNLSYSI